MITQSCSCGYEWHIWLHFFSCGCYVLAEWSELLNDEETCICKENVNVKEFGEERVNVKGFK